MLFCACSSSRKGVEKGQAEGKGGTVTHLTKVQKALVEEAMEWIGTPYKYAEQDKGVATDCSGLVMQVYLKVLGVRIPRNSAKQAEFCRVVKESDLLPGDLCFFATGKDPDRISHVGIMLDSDRFVHASSSKGVVISHLSNPWYRTRLKKFGRPETNEKK